MNKTLEFNKKDLNKILDEFSKRVGEKEFKKMSYSSWIELAKHYEEGMFVEAKDHETLKITSKKQYPTNSNLAYLNNPMYFKIDDKSFGQFLHRIYFKEDAAMQQNTSASASTSVSTSNLSSTSGITNVDYNDIYSTTVSPISSTTYATTIPTNWWEDELLSFLKKHNISLKNSNGQYKSAYDILNEISKIFNNETEKEKKNKMTGFNFDFGPCTGDNIRMSLYGMAVKNAAGTWVSYNAKDGNIVDVDVFNFDGGKYMFKMPVAVKDISVGDIVIHNRKPMFITSVDGGKIEAIDVCAGEAKTIIPTTNMFGFNFVTKIVSMFSAFSAAPSPESPFGNMLPFLMMDGDNKDIDPMMMFMMMNNSGSGFDMSNPMMLYFLMKDKDSDSTLPLMMMMMNNK